jgi:hypothetical protein
MGSNVVRQTVYLNGVPPTTALLARRFVKWHDRSSFADGPFAVETLILSRSEVAALLEPHIVLTALRDAFVAYSTGRTTVVPKIFATSTKLREGAYTIEENDKGLIIDRTIAFRPMPAAKLFRDAMRAAMRRENFRGRSWKVSRLSRWQRGWFGSASPTSGFRRQSGTACGRMYTGWPTPL